MVMDPVSFWLRASVFWLKIVKQQQESYMRMVGAFAEKIPHEDSAQLSAEAEAMKDMLNPAARKPPARRAASTAPARKASSASKGPGAKSAARSAALQA